MRRAAGRPVGEVIDVQMNPDSDGCNADAWQRPGTVK